MEMNSEKYELNKVRPFLLVEDIHNEEVLIDFVDNKEVEKCTEELLMMRLRGTQIEIAEKEIKIYCWVINIVVASNETIRLPLLIKLVVNDSKIIKSIEILNEFKGSQGILCSKLYLQNRLNESLVNSFFGYSNRVITSETELACLHIHEALLAGVSFLEYCCNRNLKHAFESETNYIFYCENAINMIDRHISNIFEEKRSTLVFPFILDNMKFTHSYKLKLIGTQKIIYSVINLEDEVESKEESVLLADSEIHIRLLRIFLQYLVSQGKSINCSVKFSFSCYYPVSLTGLLTQALALKLYSNNYIYFQQCLMDLQRRSDSPRCVGAINNYDEGKKFYNLSMEDLIV